MTKDIDNSNKPPKMIAGPINVIRLEGKIANVKKVVYLFLDRHMPIENQSKCPGFDYTDVEVFLKREFEKTKDKTIDFFHELGLEHRATSSSFSTLKSKYIHELQSFFFHYLKGDGKSHETTFCKNIRFHTIDPRVRGLSKQKKYIERLEKLIDVLLRKHSIVGEITDKMIRYCRKIMKFDIMCLKMMKGEKVDIKNAGFRILEELINKTIGKWHHEEYRNIFIKKFVDHTIQCFEKLIDDSKEIIKEIENIKKIADSDEKYFEKINESCKKIILTKERMLYDNVACHSHIPDFVVLRRILDKDYLTHSIIYTGGHHSIRYMIFLYKYMKMKITHTSHIAENITINDIEEAIADIDDSKEYQNNETYNKFFELFGINYNFQCSDITDFPDNFE